MACERKPQRAPTNPNNQGESPAPPTGDTTQDNATLSEAGSSSSLTRGSLAPTDVPEPIPVPQPTPGPAPPASTE